VELRETLGRHRAATKQLKAPEHESCNVGGYEYSNVTCEVEAALHEYDEILQSFDGMPRQAAAELLAAARCSRKLAPVEVGVRAWLRMGSSTQRKVLEVRESDLFELACEHMRSDEMQKWAAVYREWRSHGEDEAGLVPPGADVEVGQGVIRLAAKLTSSTSALRDALSTAIKLIGLSAPGDDFETSSCSSFPGDEDGDEDDAHEPKDDHVHATWVDDTFQGRARAMLQSWVFELILSHMNSKETQITAVHNQLLPDTSFDLAELEASSTVRDLRNSDKKNRKKARAANAAVNVDTAVVDTSLLAASPLSLYAQNHEGVSKLELECMWNQLPEVDRARYKEQAKVNRSRLKERDRMQREQRECKRHSRCRGSKEKKRL
jgi:hypothetical protein